MPIEGTLFLYFGEKREQFPPLAKEHFSRNNAPNLAICGHRSEVDVRGIG